MEQQFFQSFGPEFFNMQQPQSQIQEEYSGFYKHNYVVLEIANNWSFVRWTMCKLREGWLKHADEMEQYWLNFIQGNNIDVESFKNKEEFLEKWFFKEPN